jgi:hypothetical protein
VDAHSVALDELRSPGLVRVQINDDLVVMGMLADRHDKLGRARTQAVHGAAVLIAIRYALADRRHR